MGVTSPCPVSPGALSGSTSERGSKTQLPLTAVLVFATIPNFRGNPVPHHGSPVQWTAFHSTHLYRRRCVVCCKKSKPRMYPLARTSSPGNRCSDRSHRTGGATSFSRLVFGVWCLVFSRRTRPRTRNTYPLKAKHETLKTKPRAKSVRGHVGFSRRCRMPVATERGPNDRDRRRDIDLVPW